MTGRRAALAAFADGLPGLEIGATFNQYAAEDPAVDRPGAAAVRLANLRGYLDRRAGTARVLVIGEAPGYRGWRFSGIPFTDERSLPADRRTSLHAPGWRESSSTIVGRVLDELDAADDVVLWATVPLHPHRPAAPLSNRTPTRDEARAGAGVAARLLAILDPELVIAVGRIAAGHFPDAHPVRHPAHGGASLFRAGMHRLLGA